MAEHPGFLQAIIEEPDNDAHRLIYADWLEEQGKDERAELIRVQLELARFRSHYDAPRDLLLRDNRLQMAHRGALLAPFLDLGLTPCVDQYCYGEDLGISFIFRRGFVEEIEVWGSAAARQFVQHGVAIFALTPLRHLRFWARSPCHYVGPFDPIDLLTLRSLVALPHVGRLRTLDLRDNELRDDEGRALLGSPHLTNRTNVCLAWPDNRFSPRVATALRQRFREGALNGNDGRGDGYFA
jgi:uncharacterized protein (TIGR02996 family)